MRLEFRALFLLLAAGAAGAQSNDEPARRTELIDRVVAVVNYEVITSTELDRESSMALDQLRKQGTPLPSRDVLERQLLERLVTKAVLMQHASQTGLRVADPELDQAVERIAAENKMNLTQLRDAVERSGMPFSRFREDVRGEMLIARLREREVEGRVSVTDAEIESFMRQQEAQPEKVDDYNISHILVSVPEQATPDEVRARRTRAEAAVAQLKSGADFRQVAASYSDAPDALDGGNLGWRPVARLPTIFVDGLKNMKVGQISEVLRSPAGFHILKLNDKRGTNSPIVMTQTHARHILIRLNEVVSESDAKNRLNDLKYRVDQGADFAELARLHSDDASAARGGDLGWVTPGDTVPEFERQMNATKLKQVSQPFKTPFGWHIVQVLERREKDLAEQRQLMAARQAIRSRKSDELWQDWVRQVRDKAYVEYHTGQK
jgi:peptidyl-prolyl cis-trans isomerase SurA